MRSFYVFFLILFSCIEKSIPLEIPENKLSGIEYLYISQSIDGENRSRKIIIHANEDPNPDLLYPIVFFFHGNGGEAESWLNHNQDLVDDHQFIGVYPQGYKRSWNLGKESSNADDVEFSRMIMAKVSEYENVDLDKVFAIGTSNGSALVNELGIKVDFLRGIGPIASQLLLNQSPSKSIEPLSIYQVCGSDDQVIPYDGGVSGVGHEFRSSLESASMWADAIGCDNNYNISVLGRDSIYTYSDCDQNNEVIFRRVEGGNHNLNGKGRLIIRDIWRFFNNLD